MPKIEESTKLFKKGYSCSQAILIAYGPELGLDRENAMKIAGAFGGGLGNTGYTCGAVSGALMALGLKYSRPEASARKTHAEADEKAQEFLKRFENQHKSIICETLIGCDLSTPGGKEEAQKKNVFQTICVSLVRDAAELLEDMLDNRDQAPPGDYPDEPYP